MNLETTLRFTLRRRCTTIVHRNRAILFYATVCVAAATNDVESAVESEEVSTVDGRCVAPCLKHKRTPGTAIDMRQPQHAWHWQTPAGSKMTTAFAPRV